MHNFRFIVCMAYLYFIPREIFSSNFFACSYFLHVLHFDVLRRQIEIEVKTEISLGMAVMLDHPWQSLYTYVRT